MTNTFTHKVDMRDVFDEVAELQGRDRDKLRIVGFEIVGDDGIVQLVLREDE